MYVPHHNVRFVLADRGYDVWMGNVRGSTYGKQHKSLQVQSKEFWNFTFHEHAILDLPAQIDYVLEFTGTKAVPYVGVSQGTLIFFTMMSERPEYNQKVKVFGALAPFNKLAHMDVAVLATFAPYTRKYLSAAYDKLMFGVLPSTFFPMPLVRTFCALPTRKLCASIGDSFMNFGAKYVNQSRFPVYLCHIPAGTSMKNVLHYAQLVTSKEAIMFDYGKEKNVRIYGQEEPRQYNIKNVQTDVGIFWSRGDQLVTPDNVRELIRNLGAHVKLDYFIDDPYYTHPHFNVAIHNEDVLYPVLVPFLDRYVTSA
ncbi:lipase member K-like [Haemaphysalis longicornis]